tara:strand:+ start:606 stop:1139 length:534 start_codon:yes stop_codon:yes gene_type:complete
MSKAKELYKLLNRIDNAIKYENYMDNDPVMWEYVLSEVFKLKSYTKKDLNNDIKALAEFRSKGFDLYNRSFWNIGIHESICACASPLSSKLRWVSYRIKTRVTNKYKRPTPKQHGHTDVFVGGEHIGYLMPSPKILDPTDNKYVFETCASNYTYLVGSSKKNILTKIKSIAENLIEF